MKVRFPLAEPLAFGVNVTVNDADCPAAIVFGKVIPDNTNSLLSLLPEDTVTDAPLAFSVPVNAELEFTFTLPKFKVAGVTASCPGAAPVPDNPMFSGELDASDTMASVPLAAPVAVGANFTLNVTLCPAFKVVGSVSPEIENPAPVTFAWVMVTAVPPVLLTVSDR